MYNVYTHLKYRKSILTGVSCKLPRGKFPRISVVAFLINCPQLTVRELNYCCMVPGVLMVRVDSLEMSRQIIPLITIRVGNSYEYSTAQVYQYTLYTVQYTTATVLLLLFLRRHFICTIFTVRSAAPQTTLWGGPGPRF